MTILGLGDLLPGVGSKLGSTVSSHVLSKGVAVGSGSGFGMIGSPVSGSYWMDPSSDLSMARLGTVPDMKSSIRLNSGGTSGVYWM